MTASPYLAEMDDNEEMHHARRIARSAVVLWLVGLVVFSSLTQALPLGASAAEPSPPSVPALPTSTTVDPRVTTAAEGEAGVTGANTPQRTGRDVPPRRQRVADTLIWLFLVLMLVVGILLAVSPGRVHRTTRSPDDTPPSL